MQLSKQVGRLILYLMQDNLPLKDSLRKLIALGSRNLSSYLQTQSKLDLSRKLLILIRKVGLRNLLGLSILTCLFLLLTLREVL